MVPECGGPSFDTNEVCPPLRLVNVLDLNEPLRVPGRLELKLVASSHGYFLTGLVSRDEDQRTRNFTDSYKRGRYLRHTREKRTEHLHDPLFYSSFVCGGELRLKVFAGALLGFEFRGQVGHLSEKTIVSSERNKCSLAESSHRWKQGERQCASQNSPKGPLEASLVGLQE